MFSGSLCAIVTPMTVTGDIDYIAFERLVDWHLDNHTDGLVVLGTTGESPTIGAEERVKLVKQVVSQVAGRVPVIIGTGTNSTQKSIEMTKQAMQLGADGALLVTPYYNRPTQEGLYLHFKAIAEAVPMPQILYNVPTRTGCDLLPETVARLDQIANIVAIKEASGKIQRLHELQQLDCQMAFLSGDDNVATEFILEGGKGVISVAANVIPEAMHQLVERAIHGDREQAEKMNTNLKDLFRALTIETNPIPTKWALSEMGKIANSVRLPMTPLAETFHGTVRAALQAVGLT